MNNSRSLLTGATSCKLKAENSYSRGPGGWQGPSSGMLRQIAANLGSDGTGSALISLNERDNMPGTVLNFLGHV